MNLWKIVGYRVWLSSPLQTLAKCTGSIIHEGNIYCLFVDKTEMLEPTAQIIKLYVITWSEPSTSCCIPAANLP